MTFRGYNHFIAFLAKLVVFKPFLKKFLEQGILNLGKGEYFLAIEGEDGRCGRVVIERHTDGFAAEVDIIQKESGKIWWHVARFYGCSDEREALDQGVCALGNFLKGKEFL